LSMWTDNAKYLPTILSSEGCLILQDVNSFMLKVAETCS
jgi:hypothetical protein